MVCTTRKPLSVAVAAAALGWAVLWGSSIAPAQAQSFEEALTQAYQNNPTLQSRRATLRSTNEGVPLALSNWRPAVDIEVTQGWQRRDNDPGANNQQLNPRSATLTVVQNLFNASNYADLENAEKTVLAERATLHSVEQTVLVNAARAYFNVLRDEAVLELNRNNEDVLRRQLQAAQDRFRVGEITRTDVAQAESRLAGAVSDTIESEGDLEVSRANFEQVVGVRPTTLSEPLQMGTLPQTLDDAIAMATTANPDVVAAFHNWDAAQASIKSERGALLPTLDASFTYTHQREAALNDFTTNTALVTGTLTIPIYQQGSVYSQVRAAKHAAGQARLDADQERNTARESATQSWESRSAALARVDSFNAQIEAAAIALEGVQREAQVGSRTVLDVLDAEQELLTARVNLVRAKRDVAVSTYELLTAIGQMTASDLGLNTPIYDETEHYRNVRNQWFGSSHEADQDAAYGLQ